MSVVEVSALVERSWERPAPKNHSLSLMNGPPSVASYAGITLATRGSVVSIGYSARHLSSVNEVRNEPLQSLPPDLVIVLAMPPLKRPYSADTLLLVMLISWMAS